MYTYVYLLIISGKIDDIIDLISLNVKYTKLLLILPNKYTKRSLLIRFIGK